MKNLIRLSLYTLCFGLCFTACEVDPTDPGTDPGGGTDPDAPEIAFVQETGFISSDATVEACEIFNVKLTAAAGVADITGVIMTEDGGNLPNADTRVTVDQAAVESNTIATLDTETRAFTWDVAIKAHADVSTKTYGFVIVDADQKRTTLEVVITTNQVAVVEPTITVAGSSSRNEMPGTKTCFRYNITAGSPLLSTISVFGTDALGEPFTVDPSRLCFGASTEEVEFATNPLPLTGDDKAGFDKNICIRAQDDASLQNYDVVFSDEAGNIYINTVTIDTRPQGMTLTVVEGVLLNQAGPSGTGGLDLDNTSISGGSVGSGDPEAELKDEGIDVSQPDALNWVQRISGANGTTIKQLIPRENGLSENFTFSSVTTDVQLAGIWGNGVDFTSMNTTTGEAISKIVEIGDLYIVNRDANYYLLEVTNVNVTPGDNTDSYTFNVAF